MCNILLMALAIATSFLYANNIRHQQISTKQSDFISTVESMKSVSQNYIDSERGYVQNWATYISKNHMSLKRALEFLREINTDAQRYAHIVDMDTFEAWSAQMPEGEERIATYRKFNFKMPWTSRCRR